MSTKIIQLSNNSILRKKAQPLSLEEIASESTQSLIQTMRETLHGKGVGLAAPQIGYSLQIAVIEDLETYINLLPLPIQKERQRAPIPFHAIINPKIIWKDKEEVLFFEGCLSITNSARIVPRAKRIKVECLNEKGQKNIILAEGWYARILQHEIDHLQGTLCIDTSDPRTEITRETYAEKWLYAEAKDIQQYYTKCLHSEKIAPPYL